MKKLFVTIILAAIMIFSFCILVAADQITVGQEGDYSSITDAVAAAADGDEIIVSGGIYDETKETFPIVIEKSVYLHGSGEDIPVISSQTLDATVKIEAEGCTIEDISVEFIRSGFWALADNITINRCSFLMADDQWRETSCALWCGGAKYLTLTGCNFTGCGAAFAGPAVTLETADVPVLTAMFEVGEDQEFFTTHTIENNTVNGKPFAYVVGLRDTDYSEECGQILAVNCENVNFKDLDVSRASIGIQVAYSSNVNILNSVADDCGVFGVYVCKSSDCVVQNVHADSSAHGFDLRDVDRCMVSDCRANSCGQGIFYSWGRDCVTVDCEMNDCGTGYFSASGEDNNVIDCQIERNELGLYIKHEPFYVTNTSINDNTSCGLRTTDCNAKIYGCSFDGNLVGILALSGCSGIVTGNTFDNSKLNAIYIQESDLLELHDNRMGEGEEPFWKE